jgi:resolvase-like protein
VDVPLASTFVLSTKTGRETYVEPVVEGDRYRLTVKVGRPKNAEAAKDGTKLSRGANFKCVMSETPITGDYIKAEGEAGRMDARLIAIVADGERGRIYLAPTPEMEVAARKAAPTWKPEVEICGSTQYLGVKPYGAKDDRPGLTQALWFVRAGDVLVVWKLDRLGRSLPHLLCIVDTLKEKQVAFRRHGYHDGVGRVTVSCIRRACPVRTSHDQGASRLPDWLPPGAAGESGGALPPLLERSWRQLSVRCTAACPKRPCAATSPLSAPR